MKKNKYIAPAQKVMNLIQSDGILLNAVSQQCGSLLGSGGNTSSFGEDPVEAETKKEHNVWDEVWNRNK